jgi:hypothetical protein
MKLWFGPYKGRHTYEVPREHLRWILRQPWISDRWREQIENALVPDNVGCLGPRWWYLQRQRKEK